MATQRKTFTAELLNQLVESRCDILHARLAEDLNKHIWAQLTEDGFESGLAHFVQLLRLLFRRKCVDERTPLKLYLIGTSIRL